MRERERERRRADNVGGYVVARKALYFKRRPGFPILLGSLRACRAFFVGAFHRPLEFLTKKESSPIMNLTAVLEPVLTR